MFRLAGIGRFAAKLPAQIRSRNYFLLRGRFSVYDAANETFLKTARSEIITGVYRAKTTVRFASAQTEI
ncbi:MAG TPA: hypothetical protein DCL73_13915 [Treponema sp.]|nr:hypothetical protein [Treponema sp.]